MCSQDSLHRALSDFSANTIALLGDKLDSIILYGSYARGDMTEDSDVDLLLLLNLSAEDAKAYRRAVSDMTTDIDLQYGVLISPVLQSKEEYERYATASPFFLNVGRDGIRVA